MIKISQKTLDEAIKRLSATDDGKIFLAALKDHCKWDDTLVGADPIQTHFFAAKRGVYGGIRKYVRPAVLKEIEYDYVITKETTKKDKADD